MTTTPDAKRRPHRAAAVVCRVLGTVILLAVLAVCLPLSVPKLLGYQVYDVVSGSMDPAIPVHSVVLVQPAAPEELQPGEIVAYRSGSSVVIHRLVENHIVEGELVTKGDANAEPDPLKVEYAGVLGTVTAHIPFIGIYAGALNTLPGKLYAFGFIVAAAMLYLLAHELSE
jgi:signal peptidase I